MDVCIRWSLGLIFHAPRRASGARRELTGFDASAHIPRACQSWVGLYKATGRYKPTGYVQKVAYPDRAPC
jgi:hypothetical protein